MKTRRRRLSGPASFGIYLIVVFSLAMGLPKALSWALGTPYPMATITSQSMWPTLKRGDLVFVARAEPRGVKKGRIIVYRLGESFIIHRVVDIDAKTVTTKGDANPEVDSPVARSDIVGIIPVLRKRPVKIPYLGHISFALNRSP